MRKIYKGISSLIMTAFCALGASAQNAVSVPADDIPSSLKDATEITLTGEWGNSEFSQLKTALGTSGFGASNAVLEKLDMTQATIAEGTSLLISGFPANGAFFNCTVLKEVVMPVAAEAAKFTSFEKAFQNCAALETIDLSGLTNVATFNNAFYGCTSLKAVDLSTNTAAVTSSAWTSAFEGCAALTEVKLPAGFVSTNGVFADCTALQTLDWTACTATEAPELYVDMLEGVELSGVTLKLNHEQYVLFAADAEGWAQLKLEDQNPEPEEPSTEYTVDASDIPASLTDATVVTLTGEWGNSEFSQLKSALGAIGFNTNSTLVKVDMSGAAIAEGTSLLINGFPANGAFTNCTALTEVVMPAAAEAAKFTSFEKAFMNCAALATIDLSGLTNVTTFNNAFFGCTALQSADLSTNTAATTSGAWTSAFEGCTALAEVKLPAGFVPTEGVFSSCTSLQTLDWTTCTATESAPVFYVGMLEDVTLSGVTLKLNHEQYVLFAADESWSQLKLEDQNPEPEEPSTEYTVDASDIPASLTDATVVTLTGEWGNSEFSQLKSALGAIGFNTNSNLVKVDMSGAAIAEGTSLLITGFPANGAFANCKALTEVVMPAAAEAAKFTSFEKAFMNCAALATIDLSGLTNVTTFNNAFFGCTALQSADLSTNTAATTSGAWTSAFEGCTALAEVKLPAGFVPTEGVFSSCTSLQTLDWTACTATESAPVFYVGMLEGVTLSGVTLKLNHEQYVLFAADESWSQLKLEDQNPDPEEPSTEYTVDASDIPSSLRDATVVTLTGEWDGDAFNSLCMAMIDSPTLGTSENNTLQKVDMSAATIAEGTSLFREGAMAGLQYGIFRNFKALAEVVMPAATEAAKFTDFSMAFQNCSALATIDLSGCSGVTSLENAFSGCSALTAADLSAMTALENMDGAFEDCEALASVVLPAQFPVGDNTFAYCNALAAIDWTAFAGTEVPELGRKFFMGVDDLKAISLSLTYEGWKLFSADEDWSGLTLVNTEPEKVTDFTVDASEAADLNSLKRAVTLTLTGEWDGDALNFLSMALGNNGIGNPVNATLEKVDMSAAIIAEGTELYRHEYLEYGIFNRCTALKEVILPAAEEAAKFTNLTKAFEGCTALTDIDLSLLTGATDIDYAFSGTAITKADLSGCTALGSTVSAFEGCAALEEVTLPACFVADNNTFADCVALDSIDFTAWKDATEAPACKGNTFAGLDDPATVTLKVDATCHEVFEADSRWGDFNIVYDGKPDGVRGVRAADGGVPVTVYTVDGRRVGAFAAGEDWTQGLKPGLYIANGRKVAVGR